MSIINRICATVVKCDFVSHASLSIFFYKKYNCIKVYFLCNVFVFSQGGQLVRLMPVLAACHLIYDLCNTTEELRCIVFLFML